MGSLTAQLLVATPQLWDPNFHRTVVLVCQHDDDGALGVVLNRPSDELAAEYLPMWEEQLSQPDVVFVGGPVQPETALGVARATVEGEADGWLPIGPSLGLLDLAVPPERWAPRLTGLRVFSGYAGWVSDQLEEEIDRGDWFVVRSLASDVFTADPVDLWRDVLRRQPDRTALYALFPADPSLN